MRPLALLFTALFLVFSGAASLQAKDKFVKSMGQALRYREATSYPNQAEKRDIVIGADFLGKSEQKRLLGNKNGKYAVVEVAITNNSRFRLYVNTVSFFDSVNNLPLYKGTFDDVARASGPSGSGNKKALQLSILRNNLIDKGLQANIVLPGETIQGLTFMKVDDIGAGLEMHVDVQNLKRLLYLNITVPLSQ